MFNNRIGLVLSSAWSTSRGSFVLVSILSIVLSLLVVGEGHATSSDERSASNGTQTSGEYSDVVVEETYIVDRWGDRLKTYLYFPAVDGEKAEDRFPVILFLGYGPIAPSNHEQQTISGPNPEETAAFFARHGYVYAFVKWSGTAGSEGRDWIFSRRMQFSSYDVVEWLGGVTPDGSPSPAADWSTGRVGTEGCSGNGLSQLVMAQHNPPHLATIVPECAPENLYIDYVYPGGMRSTANFAHAGAVTAAPQLCSSVPNDAEEAAVHADCLRKQTSTLRLVPRPYPLEFWQHPTFDAYWQQQSPDLSKIQVPIWVHGAWNDVFTRGSIAEFEESGSRHKLLAMGVGGHRHGPAFEEKMNQELLRWYDYWLKGKRGNGIGEELRRERFRYYVQEENRWRSARTYPIPGTRHTEFYLQPATGNEPLADGTLTTDPPASADGQDTYVYTPGQGRLGRQRSPWTATNPDDGLPYYYDPTTGSDQRLEQDSLQYLSPPLSEDTEVTGNITMKLWASTSSADTDFVIKLIDVFPSDGSGPSEAEPGPGHANLVTTGWLKGTHRDGHAKAKPIPTGEVVQYEIEVYPTSYLFRKGHRIGVLVASGDRSTHPNPNPAVVDIQRTEIHPSHITLPIVPRKESE